MRQFELGREEVYPASAEVWAFKKVNDYIHGLNLRLCNMAGDFPFVANGLAWPDSERMYLCGEFSLPTAQHETAQRALLAAHCGYQAKRFVKGKYRSIIRTDFRDFRLQWMFYVVWQKCKGNADFRDLLTSVPEHVTLVENTTTDSGGTAEIWGCKNRELTAARKALEQELTERLAGEAKKERERLINVETNKLDNVGEWRGQNNIGKILMMCRDCIVAGSEPEIDYDLLRRSDIHILGQKLTF